MRTFKIYSLSNFQVCYTVSLGFSRDSEVKNPPAMEEFDPWVRKTPWRRKWHPTLAFLPGKSHDRRAWRATVHGVVKELDGWTTKQPRTVSLATVTMLYTTFPRLVYFTTRSVHLLTTFTHFARPLSPISGNYRLFPVSMNLLLTVVLKFHI